MKKTAILFTLILLLAAGATAGYRLYLDRFYYSVEITKVKASPDPLDDLNLVDDTLDQKNPVFNPELVDQRDYDGWQINKSGAVIQLDCPDIRPDRDTEMIRLYSSYADAVEGATQQGQKVLPSVNMLDGIAKQFDDGLYAALDLACFQGAEGVAPSAVDLVEEVFDALPPQSEARPFLAAALKLAGRPKTLVGEEQIAAEGWFAEFEADSARSKPISFYTWNPELRETWKFFRFLQHEFDQTDLAIPLDIAGVIAANEEQGERYQQLIGMYTGLSNPMQCLNISQLAGAESSLIELAKQYRLPKNLVCVLPASTNRETVLFDRLLSDGLPPQSNLMIELIRRIRSGEVDLAPYEWEESVESAANWALPLDSISGWYDYQVFALESLVVPERGSENGKLLLTSKYKRRLIQAFQALITKRRETHARQMVMADSMASAMPPRQIKPRLRVEPCATFYLRTARSYAFLESFLNAILDDGALSRIHGLRESGERESDLQSELSAMKKLFLGFHLVACEDIGMASELTEAELRDEVAAYAAAVQWLSTFDHRDLAVDTRVAVPLVVDRDSKSTLQWATIGIRLVKLKTAYKRAPKIRENAEAEWQDVENSSLASESYVIAVDEFTEFRTAAGRTLTRQEIRELCDQHGTKSAIVKALSN